MTARPARQDASVRSPFTGRHVHELLGLALSARGPRPLFDDDRWDLRGVQGAPIQVNPGELDWDFTEIPQPHWRLVVREFMVALRAPHHERIARLPWARREPLSLRTCAQRRFFAVAWLRWLAANGVQSLEEVTQEHCDRCVAAPATRRGCRAPAACRTRSRRSRTSRTTPSFSPPTATGLGLHAPADKYATRRKQTGPHENKTPPVPDSDEAGAARRPSPRGNHRPLRCFLAEEELAAHRQGRTQRAEHAAASTRNFWPGHCGQGQPLPEADEHVVRERLSAGWGLRMTRCCKGQLLRRTGP